VLVISILANIAYHLWNMPENVKKAAVSAVLAQASMPVAIGITSVLVRNVGLALLNFLREFLPRA
jgi:hypothetical protein